MAATAIELLGGTVPARWDGQSFASSLREGREGGRESLVVSQNAWSCQRSVRFEDYICIRSYHDGYHAFPEIMLFDLKNDPHEQHDLAPQRPDLVARAMQLLDEWTTRMMRSATHGQDPMWTVINEGGPLHARPTARVSGTFARHRPRPVGRQTGGGSSERMLNVLANI